MSPFNIFRRHPHGDISAHADGELAPEIRHRLEAHLAGCKRCRAELDDLLSVRSALRDLPEVTAPRSFTLTPAMAEREPAPVASRATPSFVAMRVAGAGFAAVLAVVVMLDAGGIIDDTSRGSDESSQAILEDDRAGLSADATEIPAGSELYDSGEGQGSIIDGVIVGTPPPEDGSLPDFGPGAGTGGSLGGIDGLEDSPDAADPPPLDPLADNDRQVPSGIPATAGDADNNFADDAEPAVAPASGDGAPAAITADDDGVGSLLIIEIGLAAIAVLAIGGSFLMRRRAVRE